MGQERGHAQLKGFVELHCQVTVFEAICQNGKCELGWAASAIVPFKSAGAVIHRVEPHRRLVIGALAEFERNLVKERTRAGLEAVQARDRKGGWPKRLNAQQRSLAIDLFRQKNHSIHEICSTLGITKPTLYAYVKEAGIIGGPMLRK